MTKLFLDDYRWPNDCAKYMHMILGDKNPLYTDPDWVVVRNYKEFVKHIQIHGLPGLISFDHDLADGHYHASMQEGVINYSLEAFDDDYNKTGYHAAKWLVDYCLDRGLNLPDFFVHSMNPEGAKNIKSLLTNFNKLNPTKTI